jgi:hypothetical protein
MPNQPQIEYPDYEAPPILPSTNDFNNVLNGLIGGLDAGQNYAAKKAAYAKQQAQAQTQQNFENAQKTQASNLAVANALEKAASDNDNSFGYDAAKKEQQQGSLQALQYVGQYHDALASSQPNQAKAAAVAAYLQSGGQYNPTGSQAALQDAFDTVHGTQGYAIPTFYTGTLVQSGGAGYDADHDPVADAGKGRPDFGVKEMGQVILHGASGYTPPPDDPDDSSSSSTSTTPVATDSATAPAVQNTTAQGVPIVPPGSAAPPAPTGVLTAADIAPSGPPMVPTVPQAQSPQGTPTIPVHLGTLLNPVAPQPLTSSDLQGLINGPSTPSR